jgi:hypothetical protein
MVAPLSERFKGQDGERLRLLFMVPVTHSGIKTREYIEWLLLVARRVEQGFFHGPTFCNHDGLEIGSGIYKGLILEALEALLEHQDWEAS